jgi:hypothetical protein
METQPRYQYLMLHKSKRIVKFTCGSEGIGSVRFRASACYVSAWYTSESEPRTFPMHQHAYASHLGDVIRIPTDTSIRIFLCWCMNQRLHVCTAWTAKSLPLTETQQIPEHCELHTRLIRRCIKRSVSCSPPATFALGTRQRESSVHFQCISMHRLLIKAKCASTVSLKQSIKESLRSRL